MLPEDDVEFLAEKVLAPDIVKNGGDLLVTFRGFVLPAVYEPSTVDLRIVLGASYPNANPDMFWTRPWVKLKANGNDPEASSYSQPFADGQWQRWSRHFHQGWRPGVDGLRTYLATVRRELQRGV